MDILSVSNSIHRELFPICNVKWKQPIFKPSKDNKNFFEDEQKSREKIIIPIIEETAPKARKSLSSSPRKISPKKEEKSQSPKKEEKSQSPKRFLNVGEGSRFINSDSINILDDSLRGRTRPKINKSRVSLSLPPNKSIVPEITMEMSDCPCDIFKYSLKVPNNEYTDNFSKEEHTIYICKVDVEYIFFVFNKNAEHQGTRKGLIFDSLNQTIIHMPKDTEISKSLKKKYIGIVKIKHKTISDDIILHEKKHSFKPNLVEIAIIYGKENQDNLMDMLNNTDNKITKSFKKLLSSMIVPSYDNDDIYHEVHCGVKVKYYSAITMTFDEVRQRIANCRCILILKNNPEPLELPRMEELGKVNTFFIVVEPVTSVNILEYDKNLHKDLFRLGFCLRKDNKNHTEPSIPPIPDNLTFHLRDLKDIILTKFLSCMIYDKLSHMHTFPRKRSLENIAEKYISQK
jgi:hypothetical protein